jgi:antitoxin YefM
MQTVSITQLKSNLNKYLDDVSKSSDIILIPGKSNDDAVVMLSIKEYNAIYETAHLLSTRANSQRLSESMQQMENCRKTKFKS